MLSEKSLAKMAGVDARLQAVIGAAAAICPLDFQVSEGLRSRQRQQMLCMAGKSTTLNGQHCLGRAVDIFVIKDGAADWNFENYRTVAKAVKKAAAQLGIEIEWGGDWIHFKDGPHFQLKRSNP
jgi:peptidoglycan L-alanyl-D-glutamate endopeptidase CwlK